MTDAEPGGTALIPGCLALAAVGAAGALLGLLPWL